MAKSKLTPRRLAFIDNIMKGMKLKDAYVEAGFESKTEDAVYANSSRLYNLPIIQSEIRRRKYNIAYKTDIKVSRVLAEERLIAFSDPRELFELDTGKVIRPHELPGEIRRAVASIQVDHLVNGTIRYKYTFWDKGKSLERIGRHLGMFEKDNEQRADKIIVMPQQIDKPKDAGK